LRIDVLAIGRMEHLTLGPVTVPIASSSDSTWRHSTFALAGWLKIFATVSR
jgi:hypothetical protein